MSIKMINLNTIEVKLSLLMRSHTNTIKWLIKKANLMSIYIKGDASTKFKDSFIIR